MARLLFAMAQATGHLNATFALAKALRAHGHDVRYLTFLDLEDGVRRQGFEAIPLLADQLPKGFQASADERMRSARGPKALLTFLQVSTHFRKAIDALASRELDRLLEQARPDLVLVDTLMPLVSVVCHQAGIPTVQVGTTLPLARMPGLPPIGSSLPPATDPESQRRIEQAWRRERRQQLLGRVMWRLGIGMEDVGVLLMREVRRRGFPREKILPWSYPSPGVALPELILCPRSFDYPAAEPGPDRHYVGPSLDPDRREPDFPWERLSPDKPLVYCSLGSMPDLFAHTGRFFDSVLGGMAARPDWQWVLSTGQGAHADVSRRAPAEAVVVPFAPQLALLAKASVMVTHAGLNSVREALFYGVPMVALPCRNDQPGNAARVAFHQAGVVEDISQLTAERLTRTLSEVQSNPLYRQRAQELRRSFEENERPERALQLVESFLKAPARAPGRPSASAGR